MTGLTPLANHRDDRQGARSAPAVTSMRAIHLRASIVPPSVIAVLGVGIVAFAMVRGWPMATVRLVLAGAGAGVLATLLAAIYAASAATRHLYGQIRIVRSLLAEASSGTAGSGPKAILWMSQPWASLRRWIFWSASTSRISMVKPAPTAASH